MGSAPGAASCLAQSGEGQVGSAPAACPNPTLLHRGTESPLPHAQENKGEQTESFREGNGFIFRTGFTQGFVLAPPPLCSLCSQRWDPRSKEQLCSHLVPNPDSAGVG